MSANDAGFFVSPKQIQAWKDEVAALTRKIEAGETLLGYIKDKGYAPVDPPLKEPEVSFMGSIVEFANGESPVSRQQIREHLATLGFGHDRIAKQFNTVLYKSMKASRVSFLPNGKIWKGNKK